ncbi:MAG: hypothetical protein QF464_22730, partial [Myxococcota bacterium]|nr:hypothetical protein [Myxococcota bacterium]
MEDYCEAGSTATVNVVVAAGAHTYVQDHLAQTGAPTAPEEHMRSHDCLHTLVISLAILCLALTGAACGSDDGNGGVSVPDGNGTNWNTTDGGTTSNDATSVDPDGGAVGDDAVESCEPTCGDRVCGQDGCGGVCGTCDADAMCNL